MSLKDYKVMAFLAKIFNAVDTDHSFGIDFDEFKAMLKEIGVPETEENYRLAFNEVDQDGSGEIDFFEFIELMKGLDLMEVVAQYAKDIDLSKYEISTETTETEFLFRLLFVLADYNNINEITYDQFAMCIRNIMNFAGSHESITDDEIREAFDEIDVDKSGTVDYTEYSNLVRQLMDGE